MIDSQERPEVAGQLLDNGGSLEDERMMTFDGDAFGRYYGM